MEPYIVFYDKRNNKELGSVTVRGTFEGEKESMSELLSHQKSVPLSEINTKVELRGAKD